MENFIWQHPRDSEERGSLTHRTGEKIVATNQVGDDWGLDAAVSGWGTGKGGSGGQRAREGLQWLVKVWRGAWGNEGRVRAGYFPPAQKEEGVLRNEKKREGSRV